MKNIILLIAALIAVCAASCNPSIVVTQRPGTWQVGTGTAAIYDIAITNAGTCPITSIIVNLGLPTGATLGEIWNLVAQGGSYRVTSFEPQLPVGALVNAGAIVTFPTTSGANLPGISVTLASSVCPAPCGSATVPPTTPPTQGPTQGPTQKPTQGPTQGPTPKPTPKPTSAPCNIAASLRLGSAWTTNGVRFATYYLFLTNNGACSLTDYVTSFALNGGEIINSWNLAPTLGGFAVQGFGGSLRPGDSYGGAGFNVRLGGEIQVTPYGSNCQC